MIGISAGNHAQALAWGASQEDVDALVVMWRGASEAKVAATRAYGAGVDLEAGGPAEAFDRLAELLDETGRTLVHPFDDPLVIAGQGTVGLELLAGRPEGREGPGRRGRRRPRGGHRRSGAGRAQVVAVEPELSTAVHSGLQAGRSVPVAPSSIADGLSAPFAGENALATLRAHDAESILVSEEEIAEAFRWLYTRAKLACEPAAAVALAPLLAGRIGVEPVAVVVSGGNVDPEIASAILAGR